MWFVAPAGAAACVYTMFGLPTVAWVRFGWWRGRLDYVFSNLAASGLESTCETIDRRFGSDHNPTVLVIPVPTNKQG